MAIKDTIGKHLKRARERDKLTLRQVQEKTGISNAYLSQLETGKIAKPSAENLFKLAELYRLPFELLMSASGLATRRDYSTSSSFGLVGDKGARNKSDSRSLLNNLTEKEEQELLRYLKFLRSSKK